MSNIIVGLDIGTTFIRVAIGELFSDDRLKIIAVSKVPSKGVTDGVILNTSVVEAAIKEAIEEAELMAGVDVSEVFASIGGNQVSSLNSTGQIAIDPSGRNRETVITDNAKKRAIDASKSIVLPYGKRYLHTIPREYIVNGSQSYKNKDIGELIGATGVRLEVKAHLVMANLTACKKIDDCISHLGLVNKTPTLKTLAASIATLHEEEMELGSILIDLGGGTTDVMVIYDGAPIYTTSIPFGGKDVTSDISKVKGISFAAAEEIKLKYGTAWFYESDVDEEIPIATSSGRPPEESSKSEICTIIQSRLAEIFDMVKQNVRKHSGLTSLNGCIVLTGGGALMDGVVQLCQSVWRTSAVRRGESPDLGSLESNNDAKLDYRQADFATAVGLVVANKAIFESKGARHSKIEDKSGKGGGLLKEALHKLKEGFDNCF